MAKDTTGKDAAKKAPRSPRKRQSSRADGGAGPRTSRKGGRNRASRQRTQGSTTTKARSRKTKARIPAGPEKPARARKAPAARTDTGAVRVRMYRQGLGDCFLLAFPRPEPEGGEFFVLIDCGVILGTPDGADLMREVVADIVDETGGTIDVLVATHEHWDHVSGFVQAKDEFARFRTIGEVWLAWTEDPRNETANRIRRDREARLDALRKGLVGLTQKLKAHDPDDTGPQREAIETLGRAAQVLTFFGIDPAEAAVGDGLGAAAKDGGLTTAAAMKWLRGGPRRPATGGPASPARSRFAGERSGSMPSAPPRTSC